MKEFGLLIIGGLLSFIGIMGVSLYLFNYLIKRWDEVAKRSADRTSSKLEEMFISTKKEVLLILLIVIGVVVFGILYFVSERIWVGLIGFLFTLILPNILLNYLEKRRQQKFVFQLVDALMILNSSLKGGLTLIQSFDVLVEESVPPLQKEIALLTRELRIGVPLEEALSRLGNRMKSEELTLVISAILVARETGGDLTKVFAGLIDTVRDRLRLRSLINTLTIQARAQAIIISLLGPVFFLAIKRLRPEHFNIMWEHPVGRNLLIVAAFLQLLSMYMLIRFSRIRI